MFAPSRWKPWALLLLSLGMLELLLRIPMGNASIDTLYAYAPVDGRCVSLAPNATTTYTGWLFRVSPIEQKVNALGFRGPVRSREKPADTFRVLLVGDSYTFGVGMPEPSTIAAQLEAVLAVPQAGPIEVVNFGVPGLNAEEVFEQYELFASGWEHDVVLYLLFNNDLDDRLCDPSSVSGWEVASSLRNVRLVRVFVMPAMLIAGLFPGQQEVARLGAVVDRFSAASRQHSAAFGVVVLGNPVAGSDSSARFAAWMDATEVPLLDLSRLWLDRTNLIDREYHFNHVGSRAAARGIATWLGQNVPALGGARSPGTSQGMGSSDRSDAAPPTTRPTPRRIGP